MDDVCHECGKPRQGGVYGNGDPYGDRRRMGLPLPTGRFCCWDCADKYTEWSRKLEAEVDVAFAERGLCGFLQAWVGRCGNPKPCAEHGDERCWACGAPAIKSCAETGAFVCGVPECAQHPHVHHGVSPR